MGQKHGRKQSAVGATVLLFLIAAGMTVGAVVLFRGMFRFHGIVDRVLAGIGGTLTALIGALCWFVLLVAVSGGHGNIFLYDKKTKTELPIEALNWELVRARLSVYFRIYLSGSRRSAVPPVLEPLLMPYLLLVFIDSAPDRDWERLLGEQSAVLQEMIDGLYRFGLEEVSRELRAVAAGRHDPRAVKRAMCRRRAEVEGALLSHIREHITDYDF